MTEAAFFYFNLKLTLAYSQDKSGFPSQKVSLSCALRYFIVQEDLYEMMSQELSTYPLNTKVTGVGVHRGVNREEVVAVRHTAHLVVTI